MRHWIELHIDRRTFLFIVFIEIETNTLKRFDFMFTKDFFQFFSFVSSSSSQLTEIFFISLTSFDDEFQCFNCCIRGGPIHTLTATDREWLEDLTWQQSLVAGDAVFSLSLHCICRWKKGRRRNASFFSIIVERVFSFFWSINVYHREFSELSTRHRQVMWEVQNILIHQDPVENFSDFEESMPFCFHYHIHFDHRQRITSLWKESLTTISYDDSDDWCLPCDLTNQPIDWVEELFGEKEWR